MRYYRTSLLLFIVLFVGLISFVTCLHLPFAWADSPQESIEAANSSVQKAFASILTVEKAGANITQLLTELNAAGTLLAEAENAYLNENLTVAILKAEDAQLIAEQVRSNTLRLADISLIESQNTFWFTLSVSAVGSITLSAVLLLLWKRFKRSYLERIYALKPEVVND